MRTGQRACRVLVAQRKKAVRGAGGRVRPLVQGSRAREQLFGLRCKHQPSSWREGGLPSLLRSVQTPCPPDPSPLRLTRRM